MPVCDNPIGFSNDTIISTSSKFKKNKFCGFKIIKDKSKLPLILGISIPCGFLFIAGIVFLILCLVYKKNGGWIEVPNPEAQNDMR